MSANGAVMIAAAAAMTMILCAAAPALSASSGSSGQPNAVPPNTDLQDKKGALSEKLNKSNGVIHPQGTVDRGWPKRLPQSVTHRPSSRPARLEVEPTRNRNSVAWLRLSAKKALLQSKQ